MAADYRIVTFASGESALDDSDNRVKTLLTDSEADPYPAPFTPADVVAMDLNGHPIEAGWPSCEWDWDYLPQADFTTLTAFVGDAACATVFIRTPDRTRTYHDYKATMWRPSGDPLEGNRVAKVVVRFTRLEIQA